MSVPGSTDDSSYGESSQFVCICSSGNEHSCPLHRRQHQQSRSQPQHQPPTPNPNTHSLHGSEMQAFHRQPSQPHHLADQRFAGMVQAHASAHSFLPSPSAAGLVHSTTQPFSGISSTHPSGMMTFHNTAPNAVPATPYTISPDAVWTGLSHPQLMPAISMPMAQQIVHQSPAIPDSIGWFQSHTGTSMPTEALQASGSSHTLNSLQSATGGSSAAHLPGMIPPDPLSWGSFRPSTAGQVPGPAFSDSPAYSAQSQAPSSAGPAQYQVQGLGWLPPTFERSDSLKAETLPPNSPGLGELAPTPHRHVSAPTTPVTAFDPSRSLAISDFQQGFSQMQNPQRPIYLSTAPQHEHLHSPGALSSPAFVGSSSRPSTSPRLILDNSPVPFLNRTFSTDDAKYEAVLARSHAADRAFVCAATTTRIYCRPSCASKRPDRSRLRFFSNPNAAEHAEAAGFRPCKRCKPQTPGTADQCVLAVGDCARHMVMSARNPTAGAGGGDDDDDGIQRGTLKEYSARANLSAFHFHRTFKAVTSVTLGELGKALNTLALQDALGEWTPSPAQPLFPASHQLSSNRASPPPPEEIAHLLVGWSARRARRALGGLVPSVYAAGCPDAPVRYVYAESAFGPVAVAFLDSMSLEGSISGVPSSAQASSSPMPVAADEGSFPSLHGYSGAYLSASHGTSMGVPTPSPPSNCIFLTCLLGSNAAATIQRRFPSAIPQPQYTGWIVSIVEELHRTGSREVQLPPEVVGAIRRARVWIELQHLSTPKRASSDLGTAPEASASSTSLDNL